MKYNPYYGYFVKSADMPESIGQTQSGKPVFSHGSDKYSSGFDSQDHLDAVKLHESKAAAYEKSSKTKMMTPGAAFDHKAIMTNSEKAAKHRAQAEFHQNLVNEDQSAAKQATEAKQAQEQEQKDQAKQLKQLQKSKNSKKSKKAKFIQQLEGGLADKKEPEDFKESAIAEGQKVEMEHTDDPKVAKEIAMDHLTEDSQYYKKLKRVEKSSFVNLLLDLFKGGEGSGVKGHTTAKKPYPGEEIHNAPKIDQKPKTFMPAGGLISHYSDDKDLDRYKRLLRTFEKEGMDYKGHISYDPKTKEIQILTDKGRQSFDALKEKYSKQPSETDKTKNQWSEILEDKNEPKLSKEDK